LARDYRLPEDYIVAVLSETPVAEPEELGEME